MPRRPGEPNSITAIYEATPAPITQPAQCDGLMMCLDLECKRCWGFLDDIDPLFVSTPGVTVDLDEATYAALSDVARRQGTTVPAVAQVVLRRWATGQVGRKAPRRGAVPG